MKISTVGAHGGLFYRGLTMVNTDRVQIALDAVQSVREKSPEGHLRITQCVLSSACVCPYYGREIPGWRELGLEPETIYQLYRDPTALAQAADTMRGKPVLFTHQPVSAEDHPAEITVGSVTDARFEDPDLVGSFTVWTQDAIDAIESGELKAVSAGYAYKAIPQGGVLNGQPYSLTMVDIVFNHLALVATPRVPHAIIGDAALSSTENTLSQTNGTALEKRRTKLLEAIKPLLAADTDIEVCKKAIDDATSATPLPQGAPEPGKGAKDGDVADALRNLLATRVPEDIMDQVLALFQNSETDGGLNVGGTDDDPQEMAERMKAAGFTDDQIAKCIAAMTTQGQDDTAGEREAAGAARADAEKEAARRAEAEGAAREDKERGMDKGITKQAMDAALANVAATVERNTIARMNALHAARDAVKPFAGEVALDSAAAVYRFALKEMGLDCAGIPDAGLEPLFKQAAQLRTQVTDAPAKKIAQDSKGTADFRENFGLNRIQVKG